MTIRIIHPKELDAPLLAHWRAWRDHLPDAAGLSPFFAPEFAQLVGAVRPRTRIAVLEQAGQVVGLLPYEPTAWGLGRPLAGRMSDYHAPLMAPGAEWQPAALLRACGLVSWQFDHLVAGEHGWQTQATGRASAWRVQLDDSGWNGYRQAVAQRSRWLHDCDRKMRRLARDHGPLRFVAQSLESEPYLRLLAWKSAQYVRTGLVDTLAIDWVRTLLSRLRWSEAPALTGMLSVLYAGDRVVAVHLGMRSEQVWHHYLPTYDRALAAYSPGLILLAKMIEAAPELGLRTLDFSRGDAEYKRAAANDTIELAMGHLEPPALRRVRQGVRDAEQVLRGCAPVLGAARWLKRGVVRACNTARRSTAAPLGGADSPRGPAA